MLSSDHRHLVSIKEGLERHFDSVYIDYTTDSDVVSFICKIDCGLFKDDLALSFTIDSDVVYNVNSFDIINAIWGVVANML